MCTTRTTSVIMRDVVIALIPAAIVAVMFFGLNALMVISTSIAGCVLFEYLSCKYWLKTKNTCVDYSAIITGLLLAYNLPSTMPLWMVLIGCFVAIIIAKISFGGLGKNIFNPALVGRVFLFISFPVQMTLWTKPSFLNLLSSDAQTGATPLAIIKSSKIDTQLPQYWEMFVGYMGGSLGEVSAFALLIGLFYMLYRKVITWHIPFYYLASVFVIMSAFYLITNDIRYEPFTHLLSGGLMLGAIFMATDYVTTPMSKKGQVFFAIGCGVLTVIIRLYSAYPEGVSFAILIMNAFVPLIDKFYQPRVFGSRR